MFYQYFKFKATGVPLVGVADFTAAPIGTEFEKNTGDVFVKTAQGIYPKVDRVMPSRTDSDARYGQLAFSNTWTQGNTFNGALTSTGTNIFSGDNTFNTGILTIDSAITSGGINTWNGSNTFTATSTFQGNITSSGTNTFSGVLNTFSGPVTLTGAAPISSSGNNIWNGTNTYNSSCIFSANTFGGHQIPVTNNMWDLGSTTKRWKDGWFSGVLTTATATADVLNVNAGTANNAYSNWYDFNSSAWRTFGWNDAANQFQMEDNTGAMRAVIHSGNVDSYPSSTVNMLRGDTTATTYYPPYGSIAATDATYASNALQQDLGFSYNPSTGTLSATIFSGTATAARYADLAEKYETQTELPIGTVVEVGGNKEVTIYTGGPVAGIISEKPGFALNEDGTGQYVALKGKVPAFCEGTVTHGQYCIAVPGGKVRGVDKADMTFILSMDLVGVSLADSADGMVMVKV